MPDVCKSIWYFFVQQIKFLNRMRYLSIDRQTCWWYFSYFLSVSLSCIRINNIFREWIYFRRHYITVPLCRLYGWQVRVWMSISRGEITFLPLLMSRFAHSTSFFCVFCSVNSSKKNNRIINRFKLLKH